MEHSTQKEQSRIRGSASQMEYSFFLIGGVPYKEEHSGLYKKWHPFPAKTMVVGNIMDSKV